MREEAYERVKGLRGGGGGLGRSRAECPEKFVGFRIDLLLTRLRTSVDEDGEKLSGEGGGRG